MRSRPTFRPAGPGDGAEDFMNDERPGFLCSARSLESSMSANMSVWVFMKTSVFEVFRVKDAGVWVVIMCGSSKLSLSDRF